MNKENFTTMYFLSRTFFLGIIYSLMFNYTLQDSLISSGMGILIGIIIIYIFNKIKTNSFYAKSILFILYISFIILGSIVLETFISSFLLLKTPRIIIILPALILFIYTSFKNIKVIKRVSFILFFISIFLCLINIMALTNYMNISVIFPFFISKNIDIIKSSFIFGVLSSIPNILVHEENISLKESIIYYTISALGSIIIELVIFLSLTPKVSSIYSFPEYMILKRIKLLEFIENVENIMASLWFLDYFVFMSLSFKRLYNLLNNKIYFYLLISIIILFTTFKIVTNYSLTLFIYYNCYIFYLILIILLSFTIIKKE